MEPYVVWLIVGIALVLIELATGTLYLLFLGVAAFAGALAALFGQSLTVQVIVAAVIAAVAVTIVQRRHHSRPAPANTPLELGQPVTFENWVDATSRLARVRFRGTLWDAEVAADARGESGEVLYIRAVHGQRLAIGAAPPK